MVTPNPIGYSKSHKVILLYLLKAKLDGILLAMSCLSMTTQNFMGRSKAGLDGSEPGTSYGLREHTGNSRARILPVAVQVRAVPEFSVTLIFLDVLCWGTRACNEAKHEQGMLVCSGKLPQTLE